MASAGPFECLVSLPDVSISVPSLVARQSMVPSTQPAGERQVQLTRIGSLLEGKHQICGRKIAVVLRGSDPFFCGGQRTGKKWT